MLKKILSITTALISLFSSIYLTSYAANDDEYFTYSYSTAQVSNGVYNATLKSDANLSSISELKVPDTFSGDNGVKDVILSKVAPSTANTTIRKLTTKSSYGSINFSAFQNLNALEEVEYTNSDSLTFYDATFQNCSNTLKKVTIHAERVLFTSNRFAKQAFTTFANNADAKIYVASNDVKNAIVSGTAGGDYSITEDKIVVDTSLASTLPKPEIELTCDNIKYKTEGGFKPQATVKLNGDAMDPQPKVEYELYTDQGCTKKHGQEYNASRIDPGTYYLRASVAGTETYQSNFAVKEVKVEGVDMSGLQAAIDEANGILQGDTSEYYAPTVQALQRAVDSNKSLLNNYDTTEEEVATATQAVRDAIEGLVKTADLADQDHIQKFKDTLADYRNYIEADYTEDSWKPFGEALAEMLEMNGNISMTSNEKIDAICEKIKNAANSLVEKPLDYTPLETAVNDAKTNYIDKASELESKYTAETWKKLKDAYDAGQKMLADKDSAGSNVKNVNIINAASAINNAISRLITVEQQDAYDALQDLIAEAKAYDSDQYTKSSYKALTDAITEAEKIRVSSALVSSSLDDIKAATENLQKAIDGLTFATGYLPAGDPIGYVYFGYSANSLVSSTYDGTEPVKQIRYTFDCAADANYGPDASIELEAKVDGSQIAYQKRAGKSDTEPNGSKNAKAILDLGDKPIEAGQNYELFAYTYANSGASDYIYAIRKIELLDEDGNILKTFNDVTAAVETLKQAIETAEKLDEGKYTADSYAKLKEALENAKKAVENEKLTKNEVDAAIAALRDAIRGLVEKTNSSQNPPNSGNNVVKPITTSPTTRSKADVLKAKQAAKKKMKTAKILKLNVKSKAKKTINVTWKKVKKAKGYQVQVSTSKKFKKNKIIFKKYTKKKTLKITKKIKSGKTYYVRVRAYTTYKDINGKPQKVYSKWNKKLRTVKVK